MSTRDPSDPHFLHAARSLEALLSPPVEHPRALCWRDGETLLVASRDGPLHAVEPAFGTRMLFTAAPEVAQMVMLRDRVALLTRDGLLQVWSLEARELRWEQPTGLFAGLHLQAIRGGVAVAGEEGRGRFVLLYDDTGRRRVRARVPPKTVLGADADGRPLLARSTESGMTVAPLGRALPLGDPTVHALRFASTTAVIGIAPGGVVVWHDPAEDPVNIKLYDIVQAALSPDGSLVAMGTRVGALALGGAWPGEPRANLARVEGHDGPVYGLAFSPRGRWLASTASRCWVWSY